MERSRTFRPTRPSRTALGYLLMLVGSVAAFLVIREIGMGMSAPAPGEVSAFAAARAPKPESHALMHVLVALVVVILAARALGWLFTRIHQPAVIGEVVAGILLGPSLLGRVAPEMSAFVMPPAVAPFLGVISQVGVILYMFLVGLELNTGLLRRSRRRSSSASIPDRLRTSCSTLCWRWLP